MTKRRLKVIIFLSIVVIILIPFLLEVVIFRNEAYSALTNGEWGGFLGSYIGGALGGIGTLLAVYITTKETRKIQKSTLQQIETDRELNARNERKQFTNEIAENIAKYISEISAYFYGCCTIERLNNNLRNAQDKLYHIECDIEHLLELEQQNDTISHIEAEINMLNHKKDMQKYRIEIIEKDIDKHKVNRIIANECYFLLQMKLQNIDEGNGIIKQIEYIHSNSSGVVDGIKWDWIDKETKKLQNITVRFIERYVEQKII